MKHPGSSADLDGMQSVLDDVEDQRDAVRIDAPLIARLQERFNQAVAANDWPQAAMLALNVAVFARNAATRIEISNALESGALRVASTLPEQLALFEPEARPDDRFHRAPQ